MRHHGQSSIMSILDPLFQTLTDPARPLGRAEMLRRPNTPADLWHCFLRPDFQVCSTCEQRTLSTQTGLRRSVQGAHWATPDSHVN